jgi:hypothetical protein
MTTSPLHKCAQERDLPTGQDPLAPAVLEFARVLARQAAANWLRQVKDEESRS